ncbi:hypothetical protein BC835DRAFT_365319 [Cytidiella melzeri]|nr:hypothetical protein BC835DRAFT_365319 [Cytidiella melzeri]
MTSPITDSTALPVDPVLQALIVDIDSLRARVVSYVQIDQQRRNHTRELEAELASVQQQLLASRRDMARLRDAQTAAATQFPASKSKSHDRDDEPEPEALREQRDGYRRQLRHSHKDADYEDRVSSPAQSSVMANSPSGSSVYYSQPQTMPVEPQDTSTPFMPAESTSRVPKPADAHQASASSSRTSQQPPTEAAHQSDVPEQMSPVQRTPKVKKTQSLGQAQGGSSATKHGDSKISGLSGLGISASMPNFDTPKKKLATQFHEEGPSNTRANDNGQKQNGNTKDDPYETDQTYYGPDEEQLSGLPQISDTARGKRPEATQSRTRGEAIHMELFPVKKTINCGPLKQSKMLGKVGCQKEIIDQLDELKGVTSFHLKVHGDCIFLADPIVLEVASHTCLINWGFPQDNDQVCRAVWEDGRQPIISFNTFLRQLPSKWPTYDQIVKEPLTKTLVRRWGSELCMKDVAAKVESGELQQLCIELTSNDELVAQSKSYAQSRFKNVWRESQNVAQASL